MVEGFPSADVRCEDTAHIDEISNVGILHHIELHIVVNKVWITWTHLCAVQEHGEHGVKVGFIVNVVI